MGSGNTTTIIISNDEINDIIRIIKSLEDSGEVKEQKGGFLSKLLGTLGASLLRIFLTGKGAIATSQGRGVYRAGKGKGIVRAGYDHPSQNNKMDF